MEPRLLPTGGGSDANIGNDKEFTVQQLAEKVIAMTNSRSKIAREPLPVDDPKIRQPDLTRRPATQANRGEHANHERRPQQPCSAGGSGTN